MENAAFVVRGSTQLIAAAVALLSFTLKTASAADSVDELRAAWKLRTSRIKQFEANWTETIVTFTTDHASDDPTAADNPSDLVHKVRCHLASVGRKSRIDWTGPSFSLETGSFLEKSFVRIYDGRERKEVFRSTAFGGRPAGFLSDTGTFDDGDWRFQPLILSLRPVYVAMGAPDLHNWRATQKAAVVHGIECSLIEWQRNNELLERMFISRAGDRQVIRREMMLRGITIDELTIDYADHAEAGTVCSGWTRLKRADDGTLLQKTTVDDLELRVNGVVDAAQFHEHFPPGTVVTYERTSAIAIVREDGSYRPIAPEEFKRGTPFDDLLKIDPPENVAPFTLE
jgi:hypothetical protein